MRIYVASLVTETNTFSNLPTGERSFLAGVLARGAEALEGVQHPNLVLRRFADLALRDGHDLTVGLAALAEPAGPTLHATYESLRNEILTDLRTRGSFDLVLLYLHGAMVSTGCDDCEGDLLGRARDIVGPGTAIGVELDPHSHLTRSMLENADLILLMKEYPHTDFLETAEALYRLGVATAAGEIRPVMSAFDCRMVSLFPTGAEPMKALVAELRAMEARPHMLSANFVHGFPWGDTPDTGAKVLAIADGRADVAAAAAAEIGGRIFALRDALSPRYPGLDVALDQARAARGRVVLADTGDNPGGGAPGDNTALLAALLERGVEQAALSSICDPQAALLCADAGVGSRIRLRLGGKMGESSAAPLDVEADVRAVRVDHRQTALGGSEMPMGLSAWVRIGGVDVVVNSTRVQTFSPTALSGLGITIVDKRLICVKSSSHFRAGFESLADHIILCATPGALRMDFALIPYLRKSDLAYHPRVAAPKPHPAFSKETPA